MLSLPLRYPASDLRDRRPRIRFLRRSSMVRPFLRTTPFNNNQGLFLAFELSMMPKNRTRHILSTPRNNLHQIWNITFATANPRGVPSIKTENNTIPPAWHSNDPPQAPMSLTSLALLRTGILTTNMLKIMIARV